MRDDMAVPVVIGGANLSPYLKHLPHIPTLLRDCANSIEHLNRGELVDFYSSTPNNLRAAAVKFTELEIQLFRIKEQCAKVCDQVATENKDGRKMPSKQIAAWCKLIADLCAERIRKMDTGTEVATKVTNE